MKVTRAGVNFADTHARENSYLARYELPLTPGAEVAGVTEDGRRVVGLAANGGYAEYAVVPAAATFPLPDGVSDDAGARAADPGPDRVAPLQARPRSSPRARAWSCTRRPAASARSPSSSATRSARAA